MFSDTSSLRHCEVYCLTTIKNDSLECALYINVKFFYHLSFFLVIISLPKFQILTTCINFYIHF